MSGLRLILLSATLALVGCTSLNHPTTTQDPLEGFNRSMYAFNDALDRAVVKPVAEGYVKVVPGPARALANNFFSNLDDVIVTANDLLQLKFRQAAMDASRVVFNSTFGLFGLLDVAYRIPKHNEDFGQTLGYWGIPSGPYLVLPVLGPSSLRDGVGLYGDSFFSVIAQTPHVPTRNSAWAMKALNTRANLLDTEKLMDAATIDRYSFLRDAYLMRRENLVYDGNPPRRHYEEEEE